MDIIFMSFRKSKTSDPPRILLNVLDIINLKKINIEIKRDKYVILLSLSNYYTRKNIKVIHK